MNITFPHNDETWWFSSEMNIATLSSGCMNRHNIPSWEHARLKSTSYFMKFCLLIVSKNPLFIKWIRSCTKQSFSCWLSCLNASSKMACEQYLLLTLTLDWNISWQIHFKSRCITDQYLFRMKRVTQVLKITLPSHCSQESPWSPEMSEFDKCNTCSGNSSNGLGAMFQRDTVKLNFILSSPQKLR